MWHRKIGIEAGADDHEMRLTGYVEVKRGGSQDDLSYHTGQYHSLALVLGRRTSRA